MIHHQGGMLIFRDILVTEWFRVTYDKFAN